MKILAAIIVVLIAGGLVVAGFFVGRNRDTSDTGSQNTTQEISKKDSSDFSNQGLSEFPKSILGAKNTKVLDLSNNDLESLPSEIGELTKIEELYLSYNKLTGALPAEIRKMTNLRILDASNNSLTGIPAEIGQLKELKDLDLSYNGIDTYPNELANIKDNLETLDLTGNTFSSEAIEEIKNLIPNTEVIN